MNDSQPGNVYVDADSETIWTECRACGAVITEYWGGQANLGRLIDDANDHVCGSSEGVTADYVRYAD